MTTLKSPPFGSQRQSTLRKEWAAMRKVEKKPPEPKLSKEPIYWTDVERLLKKHTELTTGDVATMTGRYEDAALEFMRKQREAGRVRSNSYRSMDAIFWRLA